MTASIHRLINLTVFMIGLNLLPIVTSVAQEPSKTELIKTLETILPLLESEQFDEAAKFVVVPPKMDLKELAGIIKNRELSLGGIRQLSKDAKFGKAVDLFGEERATHFAQRMGADVSQCYGFNHETEEATAEVIGVWDGNGFKLIRVDDVGKLSGSAKMAAATPESTPEVSPEAALKKAFEQMQLLQAFVNENPNDVGARAKLAMALNQIGNYPSAWKELMAAVKIEPKHSGVASGIDTLVAEFSKRGIFTVGVPAETIQSLLGEPSQKVALAKRSRWVYGQWGVEMEKGRVSEIVDLRDTDGTYSDATEIISTDLGGESFIVGFRKKSKTEALAYFFVPGETFGEHTQRVTVERLTGLTENSPLAVIAEKLMEADKKLVPNSRHKILEGNDDSMIIAMMVPATANSKPRHQLVRLMRGPKDLHRLTYAVVSADEPPRETQQKWLKIFQAATLKPVE